MVYIQISYDNCINCFTVIHSSKIMRKFRPKILKKYKKEFHVKHFPRRLEKLEVKSG